MTFPPLQHVDEVSFGNFLAPQCWHSMDIVPIESRESSSAKTLNLPLNISRVLRPSFFEMLVIAGSRCCATLCLFWSLAINLCSGVWLALVVAFLWAFLFLSCCLCSSVCPALDFAFLSFCFCFRRSLALSLETFPLFGCDEPSLEPTKSSSLELSVRSQFFLFWPLYLDFSFSTADIRRLLEHFLGLLGAALKTLKHEKIHLYFKYLLLICSGWTCFCVSGILHPGEPCTRNVW